jgi:transposase
MRSFLSTAVKQGLAAHTTLEQLFGGEVPAFMRQNQSSQAA